MTPVRPDTAVHCGIRLQGAVWRAKHSYGMRTLVRIQPWWWRGRGVAGVVPATISVAAGVRARRGRELAAREGELGRAPGSWGGTECSGVIYCELQQP